MNNTWIASDSDYKNIMVGDDFNPSIVFDEPRPEISRETEFKVVDQEYRGGYMKSGDAVAILYPDLDSSEIEERAKHLDEVNKRGTSEDDNQNTVSTEQDVGIVNS